MATAQDADARNRNKMLLEEFIEAHEQYRDECQSMAEQKRRRLVLNINDFRKAYPEQARELLANPTQFLPAFEEGLREYMGQIDPDASKAGTATEYFVGVEGSFGAQQVSPRGLLCHLLNRLVSVEGIVTRCSAVHPKVVKTVHWCEATSSFEAREYRDLNSQTGLPTTTAYPTKDASGNVLTTEYGLCTYRNHQVITLQEMPERAPPGQLPRSVDILLENELVDTCRPGDRMRACGTFRCLPAKANTTGMYRTLVLGNHVRVLSKEASMPNFTSQDIRNIRGLAQSMDRKDRQAKEGDEKQSLLHEFRESLAPSVYGHEFVKEALLLMLLGGVEKNLPNGTHLRGDVNVLMVGDPSTAKSQVLRFAMRIAPLAISTTGRGSSGVGLTAAVTTDSETGDRRLEAGAMVLADRGVCCIDEFDKMLDADRVAIHEVMEQQTITIAKAGIHASLNARTSVLAAANPVGGKYNAEVSPMENIGLPDSLLSRFDLLFIVLDTKKIETDRLISAHVLHTHRTAATGARPAALSVGMGGRGADVVEDVEEDQAEGDTPMYIKIERASLQTSRSARRKETKKVLSTAFLKKYIHYAKQRVAPVMSEEACSKIASEYADLRQKAAGNGTRCLPITPRTLETIIRLSTAHAKLHLRAEVKVEDVKATMDLLNEALFHEIIKKPKKGDEGGKDGDHEEESEGGGAETGADDDDDDGDSRDGQEPSEGDKENQARMREAGERGRSPAKGGGDSFDLAETGEHAHPDSHPTQDAEEPVPLDQLPEGFVERVHETLGRVADQIRNENESSITIARTFTAVVDTFEEKGLDKPTMGQVKGALSSDVFESSIYYAEDEGVVHIL